MISIGEPVSASGQELLAEFVRYGHEKPFEEIVRRYAGMVFNVCYRVTKDKHEAEDATQAVFLTLALQVKRGTEIKALGPWLQQVGKRLALDMRRSKKRRKTREERFEEEQNFRRESLMGEEGAVSADLDEVKTILHEELNKLPAKYRMPLILHYFGGLTRDEMAAELNCKASTLGVRIFRGREMLAGRLSGRGVSVSLGTFSVMMAYIIRHAVSDAMVNSTSHAATAMASGHNGIGMVSSRVIGLSRRASGAMAIGKLKIATIAFLVASSSLGAGAKVLGVLPKIDVQQIISNQIYRLVKPISQQLPMGLRADATEKADEKTKVPALARVQLPTWTLPVLATGETHPSPQVVSKSVFAVAAAGNNSSSPATVNFHKDVSPAGNNRAVDTRNSSVTLASSGAASPTRQAPIFTPLPVGSSKSTRQSPEAMMAGGTGALQMNKPVVARATQKDAQPTAPNMFASSASDLVVGTPDAVVNKPTLSAAQPMVNVALGSSGETTSDSAWSITTSAQTSASYISGTVASSVQSDTAASPTPATKTVRVPTRNGNVVLSDNALVGYGKVERDGTLNVSGKIVADGSGVDRTLDLASFKDVHANLPATTFNSDSGYYARSHGRLVLPVISDGNGSFSWGADGQSDDLRLVNSVQLSDLSNVDSTSLSLALLANDRSDSPSLAGLSSPPLGLWQLQSSDPVGTTSLTVHYDDTGLAVGTAVQLWTYSDGLWSTVSPDSIQIDPAEHLITGTASDFDYFAVTSAQGCVLPALQASPGDERAAGVPEPTGIFFLAVAGGMMCQRRRRRSI